MLSNTSPRPRAVANYFIYDKSLTLNQPNFFGKSDFQDGETFLQLYGQFHNEVLGPRAISIPHIFRQIVRTYLVQGMIRDGENNNAACENEAIFSIECHINKQGMS